MNGALFGSAFEMGFETLKSLDQMQTRLVRVFAQLWENTIASSKD